VLQPGVFLQIFRKFLVSRRADKNPPPDFSAVAWTQDPTEIQNHGFDSGRLGLPQGDDLKALETSVRMRFADRIREGSADLDRWNLIHKDLAETRESLKERGQERFDEPDFSLTREMLLPKEISLLASIGTALMILGTALLFVMPVMGIITIVGALMVLFTRPAPAPGRVRGWYIVRALAIILIISFLAGGTWSPPVWWWTVTIILGSAFFVGFSVLWVNEAFPEIYGSFVHACKSFVGACRRLHTARFERRYRRKARKAKVKIAESEGSLDQVKSDCSNEIEHCMGVYMDAYKTGVWYREFASGRNGQTDPASYVVAEDHD